jgi:hypothetical protein
LSSKVVENTLDIEKIIKAFSEYSISVEIGYGSTTYYTYDNVLSDYLEDKSGTGTITFSNIPVNAECLYLVEAEIVDGDGEHFLDNAKITKNNISTNNTTRTITYNYAYKETNSVTKRCHFRAKAYLFVSTPPSTI